MLSALLNLSTLSTLSTCKHRRCSTSNLSGGVVEQQLQQNNRHLTESCCATASTAVMISPARGQLTNNNINSRAAAMKNYDSVTTMVAAAKPIALQQIGNTSTGGVPLSMMANNMGNMVTDYSSYVHSTRPVMNNGAKLNGSSGQQQWPHPNNIQHSTAEYLRQLLKDRARLTAFPGAFLHAERLLDAQIYRIRASLFQINFHEKKPLVLPVPDGAVIILTEKVYVPVEEHPEYNFVGRILGPRGLTAKQLEMETGCKMSVRGRGSMRDKEKEKNNRDKKNWEHLNDRLHVLITVEDAENRAHAKMQREIDEVKKLLVPFKEEEDELKKRQLMELAILNGTYRDSHSSFLQRKQQCLTLRAEQLKSLASPMALASHHRMRNQSQLLGAPLIQGHHRQYAGQYATTTSMLNGNHTAAAAANSAMHAASQQFVNLYDWSIL